jgi:K+-transporting ATPase KdpF subunit
MNIDRWVGAIISAVVLVYLVYTLLEPEKF